MMYCFDDGTLMSRGHLDFIYDRLVALQQDEPPSPLFAIAGLELQSPSVRRGQGGAIGGLDDQPITVA